MIALILYLIITWQHQNISWELHFMKEDQSWFTVMKQWLQNALAVSVQKVCLVELSYFLHLLMNTPTGF